MVAFDYRVSPERVAVPVSARTTRLLISCGVAHHMERDNQPAKLATLPASILHPKMQSRLKPLSSAPGRSLAFAVLGAPPHESRPSGSSAGLLQQNAQRSCAQCLLCTVHCASGICPSRAIPLRTASRPWRKPRTVARAFRRRPRLPLTLGSLVGLPIWCGLAPASLQHRFIGPP